MRRHRSLVAALGLAPILAIAAPASRPPAAPPATASAPDGARGGVTYAYLSRDGGTFKAPLFAAESENLPVALIDDDAITLRELMRAIGSAHGAAAVGKEAGNKDFTPILERLIDARLLAREARQMGIADLPEHKQTMDGMRAMVGREILQARVVKAVRADPAEVDRIYKAAVREWKVRSVLVPNRDDANQLEKQLKAGGKFEELAAKLVAAKKAKGGGEPQFVGRTTALAPVLAALENMKVGAISPPVKLQDGFALMRVEAVRYPDNAKERESATEQALASRKKAAIRKYYDGLVKKYARVDRALLKSLDYEAPKPGLAALKKDQRVVARIEGGESITVAVLSAAVEQGFYHGVEGAVKEKRVNKEKMNVFDGLLAARVVPVEVKHQEIEKTPEFKQRVADGETGVLFSKFVEKAILPDLKLTEDQFRKYYADHKKDFTYPTFYKLESLAFSNVKAAEAAVKQLRAGTDFKWLNANAEGQVKLGDRKLAVEGTLSENGIPKTLAAVLSGARKGDYRLYGEDSGQQFYAVHVIDVTGATEQPYEQSKTQIQDKVYQESLTAAIKGWAEKLRKTAQVRILITRIGS